MTKYYGILLVTIAIFAMASYSGNGQQTLQLLAPHTVVSGPETEYQLEMHANVINQAATTKPVKVKMLMTQLTMGHQAAFCWGESCYPPKTTDFEMPDGEPENIKGGDSSQFGFKLDLMPFNTKGYDKLQIFFEIQGNTSDNVSFYAEFYVGVDGVNDNPNSVISLYPNPCSDLLNLDIKGYEGITGLRLNLYNIDGTIANTYPIADGTNRLSLSGLTSGTYLYSFSAGNRESTTRGKLVIAK